MAQGGRAPTDRESFFIVLRAVGHPIHATIILERVYGPKDLCPDRPQVPDFLNAIVQLASAPYFPTIDGGKKIGIDNLYIM